MLLGLGYVFKIFYKITSQKLCLIFRRYFVTLQRTLKSTHMEKENQNQENLENKNNTENTPNEVEKNTEENIQKEEESNKEEDKKEEIKETDETPKESFTSKIWKNIKKHPFIYFLVLVILIMFLWFTIKNNKQQKIHEREVSELITKYETEIDSIKLKNIEFSSKVFSWAVRSEMTRNNNENISQLFNTFVRESEANLLQLFDPSTNTISISTDKKTEGTRFILPINLSLNSEQTIVEEDMIRILIPITGLNERIGILNIEYKK